ncbi:MAG: (d)CMP kinase [Gammaproteobacteria bacterium]
MAETGQSTNTTTANPVPVIAIDGPGGAGKGTISQLVADRLGWHLLDSGALYRLVALAVIQNGISLDDEAAVAALASRLDVHFDAVSKVPRVLLGGQDVTDAIRSEAVGEGASRVASLARVREALVARQRAFRQPPGLVADGRDMGDVIFPDAILKVYLTASVEERVRRRHKQLKDKGINVSLSALSRDMMDRDRRDSERAIAPLKPSDDAQLLDTTGMEISAVVAVVLDWARERNMTDVPTDVPAKL